MNNDDQIAYWNGLAGERWTHYQDAMDENLGPLGQAALAAANVQSGERVLDVGCGCGDTTLALGKIVGESGRVTGIDISAPMLARARERNTLAHVTFIKGDASHAPLPRVQLVYSRFGVMFFTDPASALTYMHAAVDPNDKNSRIAFVCWRPAAENEWVRVVNEAMTPHLPAEPPPLPTTPGPFAFASRPYVELLLDAAGWKSISVKPHDAMLRWTRSPDVDVAVDFLSKIGPPSRRLVDVGDDARARVLDSMRKALLPYQKSDGLMLGAATWIVTAKA